MSAESERKTENLPEWKRAEVEDLVELVNDYDSVGVVDIEGIPSRQLQQMRRGLHPDTVLRVSRNTLLRRALKEVGTDEDLVDRIDGHVGLIGTEGNPFSLYSELEASKTPAPISAGETAPNDIVIPEGDTGMDPGPFVGDLQNVGAAARIMEGSIHVTEDSTVLEEGGEVSSDLEKVLGELGIEPKEVGLDLRGVVSEGVLFEPDDLDIDVESYRTDLQQAAARARNLSVNAVFPTAETVPSLVAKATGEAKSVGLQAAIEDEDLMPDLARKADAQVRTLAAQIEDESALPEELQDIEAPAQEPEEDDDEDEPADDQSEATEDSEPSDDEDDDDEEDAAAGLGDMFG